MTEDPRDNPSFDCISGGHLLVEVLDGQGRVAGCWCLWCGTASYDADRIAEDGQPVGFVPDYQVRVQGRFTRSEVIGRD